MHGYVHSLLLPPLADGRGKRPYRKTGGCEKGSPAEPRFIRPFAI
jgi:hypothetical protein